MPGCDDLFLLVFLLLDPDWATVSGENSKTMINQDSLVTSATDVIEPEMVRVLAAKTEAERLRIGWGMWRSARKMLVRIVSSESPELTPDELQKAVAKRMSHGT